MLEVQEKACFSLLESHERPLTILDVGGGHGQLAIPLARAGHHVTVLGSAPSCEKRIQPITHNGDARFVVGNVIDLPFPDRAFDVAISFRLLTHCSAWEKLVAELCRVADKVVVDYPTSQSLNAIAPRFFEAKKKVESNTRTWKLFRHREIRNAFSTHGFRPDGNRKQFFLPMVVHRMIKNRPLSCSLEKLFRALGITNLAGSPVVACFRR